MAAVFVHFNLDTETVGGGWQLYHYQPGTTTLKNVWLDKAETQPAAQPVVADANGVMTFFADGLYDLAVYNSAGVLKYTWSNVSMLDVASSSGTKGADLASASSLVLGPATEVYYHVTGTTTINGISGTQIFITLTFVSTPTLTDSNTFLLRNRTTRQARADETVTFVNDGGGVWREVSAPMRLPNNQFLTGRNAAGTGEDNLIKANASDNIELGGTVKNFSLDADPTTALQAVTKQYADNTIGLNQGFTTGDVKLTLKTVADPTWVLMNDTTIGDASSGASGRANADTSALFTLIWNNILDQWAPVSTGRGVSAAADFAAHKTIALPKTLGRALAGYGVGTTVETATASSMNGFTVLNNNTKWVTGMAVVASAISGFTTTAVNGTTYYVVRISSTNIRLATTLALAQNGTPDITVSGSGSATFTYTFTSRVLGEQAGEEAHAQSITELLLHSHSFSAGNTLGTAGSGSGEGYATSASNVARGSNLNTGGNAAANIWNPATFLTVMVKL